MFVDTFQRGKDVKPSKNYSVINRLLSVVNDCNRL